MRRKSVPPLLNRKRLHRLFGMAAEQLLMCS
jgi:hypothetical protein